MTATFTALLDRYVLGLLLGPIRAEFAISDTQVSLLQGIAFALFYSVLGLPFGRLVDRSNRRNIIAVGVLLWSLATICCGLARNYNELFFARLGVGFGEACLAPAAYSLLTDFFAPGRHGRALAFYTLGSVLGGGGSFIIGAQALQFATAHHLQLPVLGSLAPWRMTFVMIGSPGLIVGLLLLTISEPARAHQGNLAHQPTVAELGVLLSLIRVPLFALIVANCAMLIAGTGIVGWLAVFLARTYAVPPTRSGHFIGLLIIASGIVGAPLSGWLADSRWISQLRGEKLLVLALSAAAALPFAIWFPLAPSATQSLSVFLIYNIAYNIQACAAPAMLQDILPNRFKGQVTALYWLVAGIVGFGGGSTAIALITDRVYKDSSMLRFSMITVAVPCLVIAMICSLGARSSYQQVRKRMRGEQ
jgi:MFS family permease